MVLDDSVVLKYLESVPAYNYSNAWFYSAIGRGHLFENPDPKKRVWVSKLHEKLKRQIENFSPLNSETIKTLFPEFDEITRDYTILLVVGFPDPYDAMFMSYKGREYVIFDLIQFGEDSLNDNYSCHRVLTHELIHLCIKNKYNSDSITTYMEHLDYISFNEGFAHALSYPENISSFIFDAKMQEKYKISKAKLAEAYCETNSERQQEFLKTANTGDYWNKFASISGKLYLLKHKDALEDIYLSGWKGFSGKILNDSN